MQIRSVAMGRGLAWLAESLDVAGKRPATVFGAALLAVTTAVAAAILAGLLLMPSFESEVEPTRLLTASLPLFLLAVALQPLLMAGLLVVIARVERGEPVAANAVFDGFRGGRLLPLASLGLIQIAAAALNLSMLGLLGGDGYLDRYLDAMTHLMSGGELDPSAIPVPEHGGLLNLSNLLINALAMALLAFSVPQVALAGLGPWAALTTAFAAILRNLPALALATLIGIVGLFVSALVLGLASALLGVLGNLISTALPTVLVFAVLVAWMLALVTILAGATYLAWRDILADGQGSPPVRDASIAEL